MNDAAPAANIELETLYGDVRDAMLTRFRTMPKPWEQMTEAEQLDAVNGISMTAGHLVREAVRLLTNYEWPRAVVKLHEIKIAGGDKGIEAKVSAQNIEVNRTVLGENVGALCVLLMVDSDTFMGSRGPVEIEPDQPELPVGEEAEAA